MATRRVDRKRNRAAAHVSAGSGATQPRRQPRQERARLTVAAILEAAVDVIDEVGWAGASTNRIAARAGVSIGSLYQYFPNKEAILGSLAEQHRDAAHQVVSQALGKLAEPAVPVACWLRQLFDDLLQLHREDPALTRVLSTEVPHDPAGDDRAKSEHLVDDLRRALGRRHDTCLVNMDAAAHVLATTTETLSRWLAHEAPESLDTEILIHEIVAMLSGYITGEAER